MTDEGSLITAANVDLSNCDREQVQFSEAIQPYGALLVVEEGGWTIEEASANSSALFGIEGKEVIGSSLSKLLGPAQASQVQAALARQGGLFCPAVCLLSVMMPGLDSSAYVFAHRNPDRRLILEFEPAARSGNPSLLDLYADARATLDDLHHTTSVQQFFARAVTHLRRLTGYDRVVAYKFLEDKSGWVLAEEHAEGLQSYLGLHYPASDIPEPARRLFSLKWISHLPDVAYVPVELVRKPEANGRRLDLTHSFLRSVSPMYRGYLQNMGVHSTLVLTLLKNGTLWGLISCMHHRGPKYVPFEARTAAEFLAHVMSRDIAMKEALEEREYVNRMKARHTALVQSMRQRDRLEDSLVGRESDLLYLEATGACVFLDGTLIMMGETPGHHRVRDLIGWLAATMKEHLYVTDRLSSVYPSASEFQDKAAGLLAVRLFAEKPDFIVWLRPELVRTVHWAGDPRKPVDVARTNGEVRLLPRASFEKWKETVRGACAPWRESEVAAAEDLRRSIVEVLALRKAAALERANDELVERNQELDAFAYIASHDLREPLRGIHLTAQFMEEDYGARLDEQGISRLRALMELSRRMDDRINGLLQYARFARAKLQQDLVEVGALVNGVVRSLSPRLAELGVSVRIGGAFPHVRANAAMLEAVFANLITNAMKFNDKPERWMELGALSSAALGTERQAEVDPGHAVLYVKDNGIGIAPAHTEHIFVMFQRLHGDRQYGGGTGLGLAITQKIIERHGGRIWVESEPGRGTTFFFTLPRAS